MNALRRTQLMVDNMLCSAWFTICLAIFAAAHTDRNPNLQGPFKPSFQKHQQLWMGWSITMGGHQIPDNNSFSLMSHIVNSVFLTSAVARSVSVDNSH